MDDDLRRLDQQSEKLMGAAPAEPPVDDAIEVLGKKIARVLAYAMAAGLLYYLWAHVLAR